MSLMKRLLSLMVITLVSLGVMGCMSESKKEELLGYLEEKYGGKYEVIKYWTEDDGTSELSHQMLVHPEGEPEHLFKAGKFWHPTEKKDVLWDNRVEAKWSVDFTEKHKNLITSLDTRGMEVKFRVGVAGEPGVNFLDKEMEDYLKGKKGQDAIPSGTLMVAISCDQEPNKIEEAKLLFELYSKVRGLGFDHYSVKAVFVKSEKFEDAQKLLEFMLADPMAPFEALGSKNYYYIVYLLDIDNISNPEDIIDLFQTGEG